MALSEYARAGSGVRLLGVLLGLLMLVAGLPVASSHAEEPTEVLVELTSLAPATLSGSGELVISGRVTNQADQPLSQLTAHLWRDATPITTLSSLNAAEADPQASGEVMQSSDAVASLGDDGTLAPGASADFTVRADLGSDAAEQSWLSQPDAVYQVGVEVFSGPRELGGSSALVGYPGSTQADVGTIVLLNARPSLLPLESDAAQLPVFADGSLKADLETRLSQLLALAEQDNVLIVIDPQLYDEVTQLALPHAIRLADGSHSEATSAGSAVAQDWLNRLDALMTSGRIVRGLYGSVDVTQAVASGQEAVIKQAAELPSGHVLAALPLAVVPFSGQVDQQTVTALQSVSPRYIVASNLGDRLRYDAFGLQLLSVDASSAAQPAGNPIQARGGVLARQLIAGNQGLPSIQLVTTQSQADLAVADYSWRHRRSIADLLASTTSAGSPSWPETNQSASETLAQASSHTGELLEAWSQLVERPSGVPDPTVHVLPTAWSTAFGRDTDAQTHWLELASEPAMAITSPDAVELRISDWVTTSEDNLLPVTLINNTAFQLTVRVHFDSDNPLRISVADSDPVTVQPGESSTVRVSPVTEGNGIVAMQAQVVTTGGHPVGNPVSFTITGTEAGRVAWIIIVASGAVLLGATAYRVRSMRRENRED
ncbi:DUF6049 family protein [Brooklawnia sp.]|uniref:DUF6049 family protein n=1 Tax=Brooklawnia sp. TaxID=2699740 RepID=UPI00311DD7F1